jgi:hypothetical protein
MGEAVRRVPKNRYPWKPPPHSPKSSQFVPAIRQKIRQKNFATIDAVTCGDFVIAPCGTQLRAIAG